VACWQWQPPPSPLCRLPRATHSTPHTAKRCQTERTHQGPASHRVRSAHNAHRAAPCVVCTRTRSTTPGCSGLDCAPLACGHADVCAAKLHAAPARGSTPGCAAAAASLQAATTATHASRPGAVVCSTACGTRPCPDLTSEGGNIHTHTLQAYMSKSVKPRCRPMPGGEHGELSLAARPRAVWRQPTCTHTCQQASCCNCAPHTCNQTGSSSLRDPACTPQPHTHTQTYNHTCNRCDAEHVAAPGPAGQAHAQAATPIAAGCAAKCPAQHALTSAVHTEGRAGRTTARKTGTHVHKRRAMYTHTQTQPGSGRQRAAKKHTHTHARARCTASLACAHCCYKIRGHTHARACVASKSVRLQGARHRAATAAAKHDGAAAPLTRPLLGSDWGAAGLSVCVATTPRHELANGSCGCRAGATRTSTHTHTCNARRRRHAHSGGRAGAAAPVPAARLCRATAQ
jgi:hypothetical protein